LPRRFKEKLASGLGGLLHLCLLRHRRFLSLSILVKLAALLPAIIAHFAILRLFAPRQVPDNKANRRRIQRDYSFQRQVKPEVRVVQRRSINFSGEMPEMPEQGAAQPHRHRNPGSPLALAGSFAFWLFATLLLAPARYLHCFVFGNFPAVQTGFLFYLLSIAKDLSWIYLTV
jgi:hypothetical protein